MRSSHNVEGKNTEISQVNISALPVSKSGLRLSGLETFAYSDDWKLWNQPYDQSRPSYSSTSPPTVALTSIAHFDVPVAQHVL